MALLNCKECGKPVSSSAAACPHCGAKPTSAPGRIWTIVKAAMAAIAGLVVFRCVMISNQVLDSDPRPAATAAAPATFSARTPPCSPSAFVVSGVKFKREYDWLTFTGTVANNGTTACGVQLKVSTYDRQGAVVGTRDFWPASIRNIEAGAKENFSYQLSFDKSATQYDVVPIDARQWNR